MRLATPSAVGLETWENEGFWRGVAAGEKHQEKARNGPDLLGRGAGFPGGLPSK
jgi:hypothetical protein